MAAAQEIQSFVHQLVGKRLVQFGCEADILEFIFSDNLVLHAMGLSRVIREGDLLVTTFDYQSWDNLDSTHNDEWINADRIKDKIVGGCVSAVKLNDIHDLTIELDNGYIIECLIANAYPHYSEESEQWVLFEHTDDHSGRFLTASNKTIEFP